MLRSMKDSENEAEQKTGRVRSQRFTISSIVNSPLRRSSRIKQIKSPSPSSESDTSSISSYSIVSRSRRATMDNTETEKLKRGRPRKFSISLDDNESIDVDIIETPKKRTTRSSLAAVTTDTPTKINTRAASKRLTRAGSETKSPLLAVRTTRKARSSSVDPESLSDQNRSQPGTPVKTHKQVSNSPIKKEDEKKLRIPYVRLDATIVETDELTNSGNSDSSPDKALHSQQSPRINKKCQSISNNDEEANNDKISSIVSPTSPRNVLSASSESDETLQLSENRDDIHVDKIMDSETISVEECKDTEDLLPNEDINDLVSIKDNSSNLRSKKECKLEIIKSASEMEKLLDNVCKQSATKELMIKIGKLSSTSIEEQKGNPSNKENRTLNIINDSSIENNTQPITNVDSTSTKCLTPMCANKSSSEKETKFTKNESSLNKRRHSKESIETTMKHDILSKEGDIEEKMDISTDSSISDSMHKQKYLSSPSVNDTTKRQSLVCEADNKSTTKDTNESVLSQHEDVEIVDRVIIKDKTPIKQISKSTGEVEKVTKDKVGKMEHSIMDTNSDVSKDSDKIELNKTLFLPTSKDDADQKIDKKKNKMMPEIDSVRVIDDEIFLECRGYQAFFEEEIEVPIFSSSNSDHSVDLSTKVVSSVNKDSNDQSSIMEKQSVTTQDDINDNTKQEQRNFSKQATESVPESSNTALETLNSASNESNEDNSVIQNTQPLNETEASEYVTSISSKRAERKRMWLKNSALQNLTRESIDDIHDHMEKEKENLQLKNQKNTNTDPDVIVSTNLLRDTSSDNSNKIIEKEIDVETISVNSNSQLSKKSQNESGNESDLVMMNKKVWKGAKNLNAAEEAESDYDSENSVISLKNQLDDIIPKYQAKQLPTINKKLLESQGDAMIGNRDKKSLIMMEEEKMDYDNKAVNSSKNKKQHILKKCEDSFSSTEDEDDLTAAVNKSLIEYKVSKSLNKSGDQSVSKLNKSGQTVAKTMEQSNKTHHESDEQVADDANELNRSSQVNKKTTPLSKSMERKKSLNKSSTKDTSLKQEDKATQNISINKLDHSKNELDTYLDEIKHSKNASKSEEPKEKVKVLKLIGINKGSNDNEIIISAVDFRCKNYSTTAYKESTDKMSDSSNEGDPRISQFVVRHSDSETSTSIHSDIKREYNLDGAKQKFSDDNIPGDECRASESEDSDPDDDGSDLADFIVNDNEIEEEEDDVDDEEKEESNSEGENEQNKEKIGDAEKEEAENAEESEAEDTEKEEMDGESGNDKEDVKGKDEVAKKKKIKDKSYKQAHINVKNVEDEILDEEEDTDNEKSIKYISSPLKTKMSSSSEIKSTKIKHDSKKSNTMKSKNILLDTSDSDSDSSIKNKSSVQKKKDIILLDASSNLSAKRKVKSEVQFSSKNATENLMDQLNQSERAVIRKSPKSRQNILLEHSTPKFDTCKKVEFYKTPLEENSEIKDTKSNSTKTIQNTLLKKGELKIKDDTQERQRFVELAMKQHFEMQFQRVLNIQLETFNKISKDIKDVKKCDNMIEDIMNTFESTETTEKAGSSKPSSGMAEIYKTVDMTHTESPTIKYLRKEKLNESAPELKVKTDSNSDRLKKKLSPLKQTKDIAQTEIKLENNEKEIPNLVISLNDEAVQKSDRKKQKKRKTPAEDILDENITDKVLNQDMRESKVSKKKKNYINLATDITAEDDTCKDTRQINKKEKKQKKKQIKIIEQNENENVNEANVLQKNIRKKKKTKLAQYKGENDEIKDDLDLDLSDSYMAVEKKTKRPKIAENKEIISEKLLKKKREETSSSQIEISKLKSDKNLASNKSQDIASDKIKAKNTAFAKAREEALEAIHATEMRLRAKKELKKEKQKDEKNRIREQQVLKIPDKTQRKQVLEKNDFLQPSTSRMKRLSDDVIENLSDQPMKAKKKRKLSQGRECIPSSEHSSNVTIIKDEGSLTLSTFGSTTQFTVVSLPKAKKLSSKSSSAAAISFRQRLLARNSREPVSAYMMFLEKQKATSTNRSSRNAF